MAFGDSARTAGSVIGAVLESTGYHYQSSILDALRAPFENEVGGLIYLVAILMAVVFTATQGGTKMASWLLIGPPLFLSVIQVREFIPNARWEFAMQERTQEKVQSATSVAANGETNANVSSLFAHYVALISDGTRHLVAKMSEGRNGADIWFMVKGQLFAMMHTTELEEPGLNQLLHSTLVIDCGEALRWAQMVNDPVFREIDGTDRELSDFARQAAEAREWFRPSRAYAEEKFQQSFYRDKVTIKGEAARYVATLALSGGGAAPSKEAIDERAKRIEQQPTNCYTVWGLTIRGILTSAARKQTNIEQKAEDYGIGKAAIQNLELQVSGVPKDDKIVYAGLTTTEEGQQVPEASAAQVQQLHRIIALYHLRNEMGNPDKGAWMAWMANRHEIRTMGVEMEGNSAATERARVTMREWAEKERLIHSAANLPYYQGLILLFLGATFPFFSLLLLIPGKHGGFLIWFCLWLWAKSWDVGFAVVMLLDDLLFAIFAVDKQKFGKVLQVGDVNSADAGFGATMGLLQQLDPTFQLATYYTLVSVCVLSVPVVAGQFLLGSMLQGAGLIARGARLFSGSFSNPAYHQTVRDAQLALRNEQSQVLRTQGLARQQLARGVQSRMSMTESDLKSEGLIDAAGNLTPKGASMGQQKPNYNYSNQGTYAQANASESRRSSIMRNSQEAGFRVGAMTKMKDFGAVGGKDSTWTDVAGTTYGIQGGAYTKKAHADADLARMNAAREFIVGQIGWQEAIHGDLERIQRQMVVMGALPLPVSGFFNEPSSLEVNMALRDFEYQIEMENAYIKTYAVIARQICEICGTKTVQEAKAKMADMDGAKRDSVRKQLGEWANSKEGRIALGAAAAGANFDHMVDAFTATAQSLAHDSQQPTTGGMLDRIYDDGSLSPLGGEKAGNVRRQMDEDQYPGDPSSFPNR